MAFHVYVDRTADTGEAFYVGKGCDRRVKKITRNQKHSAIVEKHGIEREIVASFDDEGQAFEHEMKLIAEMRTFVGDEAAVRLACNFTEGGEGVGGWKHTEATCKKISESHTGKQHDPMTLEKMCESQKGRTFTDASRAKMSASAKGRAAWNRGMRHSDETLRKIGKASKGRIPWNKGKKLGELSDDHRAKISESLQIKCKNKKLDDRKAQSARIKRTSIDTGEVVIFDSINDAAASVDISPPCISRYSANDRVFRGYRWSRC